MTAVGKPAAVIFFHKISNLILTHINKGGILYTDKETTTRKGNGYDEICTGT